jgi:TetR/AcrR family transcriptional regulator
MSPQPQRRPRPAAGRSRPRGPDARKSEITREKILTAARTVFSEHPYKAASMRMIGKTGGFDHPLIHYYFPAKAELFEAVVAEICAEFYRQNLSWFDGLDRLDPRDGLPLYIDRFLDYNFKHPEAFKIISLNSSQFDKFSEIPGYQHIPELLTKTRRTFEAKVPMQATREEIGRFINSFNTLVIFYLGAAPCQAEVLGMEPDSNEYRIWVKETLIYVFLPLLEKLILPDPSSRTSGPKRPK